MGLKPAVEGEVDLTGRAAVDAADARGADGAKERSEAVALDGKVEAAGLTRTDECTLEPVHVLDDAGAVVGHDGGAVAVDEVDDSMSRDVEQVSAVAETLAMPPGGKLGRRGRRQASGGDVTK